MRGQAVLLALILAFGAIAVGAPNALADEGSGSCYAIACSAHASKVKPSTKKTVVSREGSKQSARRTYTAPTSSDFDQHKASSPRKPLTARELCRQYVAENDGGCGVGFVLPQPADTDDDVTYITISPYQAALMASAYLPLKPGKPTVGPPPDVNKWKMAAVGYPLWIWAEGDLDPAPV